MINFIRIQERFFRKLQSCTNPSSVNIKFLKITNTSGSLLGGFTGENERTVDKEITVRCFYQRYGNDKQRERAGVTEEVNASIYISPMDLFAKTGEYRFSEEVRKAYSKIAINFLGEYWEIERIEELEPFQANGVHNCCAIQINLKHTTGKVDFK